MIQGCKTVLDLGCGPATQLGQIATLNPDIQFIEIDLSATMLADAKKHIKKLGLKNVTFKEGDITSLDAINTKSMDAVISTMALSTLADYSV